MIKLIFTDFGGEVRELTCEKTVVGRANTCDLVLPDRSVSARHCEILVWGDDVIVRDLDSANGTFVDGRRLKSQSGARSGQTIRFGSVTARLEIVPAFQEDDPTEMTAIYQHNRAVKALEEEKADSAVEDACIVLGGGDVPVPEDQTILLQPPAPASESSPAAAEPPPSEDEPGKPSDRTKRLLQGLAWMGLSFFVAGR